MENNYYKYELHLHRHQQEQMESKDRDLFMSAHNKATATAITTTDDDDVNCELTLQLPHHSLPSTIDDDRRNPSAAFLPTLPYTSSVLPPPSAPSLPSSSSLPLSTSPPKHVLNYPRRSSPASRGGGAGHPYSVVGPRIRRNPTQAPGKDKIDIIPPPFPWATDLRATVRSLAYLKGLGITKVQGESQCKHCEARIVIKHDLVAKFQEVVGYMKERIHLMHDRAPQKWMNPAYPGCAACKQNNCMRPVMADKKRHINWLFLFLGQWLGFCTLEQLKYFCKHTKNHRTGAKDRVLYLSYVSLAQQLDPELSFH